MFVAPKSLRGLGESGFVACGHRLEISASSSLDLTLLFISPITAPIDRELRDRLRHRISTQRLRSRSFGIRKTQIERVRNNRWKTGQGPRVGGLPRPPRAYLAHLSSQVKRSLNRIENTIIIVSRIPLPSWLTVRPDLASLHPARLCARSRKSNSASSLHKSRSDLPSSTSNIPRRCM